jgi:mono/diheme cytochrome c family protein
LTRHHTINDRLAKHGTFLLDGCLLVILLVFWARLSVAGTVDAHTLYAEYCSVCHGEHGGGKSHAVQGMSPPPRDFTATGPGNRLSREQMIDIVRNGKPGTAMAGWGSRLDEKQIAGLVDHIRTRFMHTTDPGQADPGQQIYASSCSVCHGEDGTGALWGRTSLNPPPRNFSTTDPVNEMPRARMIASVTYGRSGTAMTAFASQLNEREIEAVVDYIRKQFMKQGPAATPARAATGASHAVLHKGSLHPESEPVPAAVDFTLPVPGNLSGDAATGKAYYLQNCTPCHGAEGRGDGPRAYFIFPRPRNFTSPENRARFNRPALFHGIREGVRGREMPAWGKVLEDQAIADITEYVFHAFVKPEISTGAPER